MQDGTDVDAQISKKRAHKNIMDEALKAERNNRMRFRMGRKKKSVDRGGESSKRDGATEPPDSGYDNLGNEEGTTNGYILDGGSIIPIEATPKIDSLNKYAFDVIKTTVKDHEEWEEEDEEENFLKMKGTLLSALQRQSLKSKPRKSIKES